MKTLKEHHEGLTEKDFRKAIREIKAQMSMKYGTSYELHLNLVSFEMTKGAQNMLSMFVNSCVKAIVWKADKLAMETGKTKITKAIMEKILAGSNPPSGE